MFFYCSKIVWALLAPANLACLLLVIGVVIGAVKGSEGGWRFMVAGFAVLFVFGALPMGQTLLYLLERQIPGPPSLPDHVDGVLVLGGATDTMASGLSGQAELNEGAERILAGIALSRRYPDARIVFSGGSGNLVHNQRRESEDVRLFLENINLKIPHAIYEDQSRTTSENIKNSFSMIAPGKDEIWLLVTSAYHMPRSMAVARKLGWDTILPYPVDHRGPGRILLWPTKFDVLDNLDAAHIALHEMTGILAYWLTGKL